MNTWRWNGSVTAISGAVRQLGVVDRHVAPAEQHLALVGDDLGDDLLHVGALAGVLRHEDVADRVVRRARAGRSPAASPRRGRSRAGSAPACRRRRPSSGRRRRRRDGSRFSRILRPSWTMRCDFRLCRLTMKPTPQASRSLQRVVKALRAWQRRAGRSVWPPGARSHRRPQPLRSPSTSLDMSRPHISRRRVRPLPVDRRGSTSGADARRIGS